MFSWYKFSSIKIQIKLIFYNNIVKFVIFIQPILYCTLLLLMFKNSDREDFISYIVLGAGMMNLWSAILISSGVIDRERNMGTLERLNSVPVSFNNIILSRIMGSVFVSLISTLVGYVFVVIVSGESVTIKHPFWFIVVFLLVITSFIIIAYMISGIVALSRQARDIINASEYPVFILCGLVFPISMLPFWTRPISYILSPTWGLKLFKMTMNGIENYSKFYSNIFILSVIIIFYYILSQLLYKRMMKHYREDGSLGVI